MKICVVTGSRAEYGLLRNLINLLKSDDYFQLQLVVTGAHLNGSDSGTVNLIHSDNNSISKSIEMLVQGDSPGSVVKSMGLGLIGYADSIAELDPDLVLLLGDRFEIFSFAAAATIFRKPIAHIHGGELTYGAYDDSLRHAITKMAHLHFATTDAYRKRIIQMGENPANVFNVGGLGVDAIKRANIFPKAEIVNKLKIPLLEKCFLITYHPVTALDDGGLNDLKNLLSVLSLYPNVTKIFTASNVDNGGDAINTLIRDFTKNTANSFYFHTLGSDLFYSCLNSFDCVIGNSSSGLLEAPSFRIPVVDIGIRQAGRERAGSVIWSDGSYASIKNCIDKANSHEFKSGLFQVSNPHDQGDTTTNILNVLRKIDCKRLINKIFYDT